MVNKLLISCSILYLLNKNIDIKKNKNNTIIDSPIIYNSKYFKNPIINNTFISGKKYGDTYNNKDIPYHYYPDGAAIFTDNDIKNPDGYLYVSNSEASYRKAGVGVYKFDRDNKFIKYYKVLEDSDRNCSGGKYKNLWLSCEETPTGQIWSVNPYTKETKRIPNMGSFSHEAITYNPINKKFYLTEDNYNGLIYRYSFNTNIEDGFLEVCVGIKNKDYYDISWVKQSIYNKQKTKNDLQMVKWEGIVYNPVGEINHLTQESLNVRSHSPNRSGYIYIVNQKYGIYCYNPNIEKIYHIIKLDNNDPNKLNNPDNISLTKNNQLLISEDIQSTPNLELWLYTLRYDRNDFPEIDTEDWIIRTKNTSGSELSGLAIHNDILMLASQRGGKYGKGKVYQIKGLKDI